jgi:hypothetical protein
MMKKVIYCSIAEMNHYSVYFHSLALRLVMMEKVHDQIIDFEHNRLNYYYETNLK